jgi:Tfp pilus assembly protein PilX
MKVKIFSGYAAVTPRKICRVASIGGKHKLADKQKGVVLFIALIALVAMTLAAIALVRSVDTGNVVAGNLAFKQGATLAGDTSTETALAVLVPISATATAYTDNPALGYYATSQDNLDMTGSLNDPTKARVDWDYNGCAGTTQSACIDPAPVIPKEIIGNGYRASYIIHRLCLTSGDPNSATNSCATYQATSTTSPKRGEIKYGDDKRFEPLPTSYYRITSRITGPRNTVSFIETIVHF